MLVVHCIGKFKGSSVDQTASVQVLMRRCYCARVCFLGSLTQSRDLFLPSSEPLPRAVSLQLGRETYLFTCGLENLSGVRQRVVWESRGHEPEICVF